MDNFKVGNMVERTANNSRGLRMGGIYKVVAVDGVWITVLNDNGNEQECLASNATLVVTNELQVGETYTSYNGSSWVVIYEEDDLVWMKSHINGPAYVFNKDGTSVSFGRCSGYNINWEVTKGPITEEGVLVSGGYHLSAGTYPMYTNKHELTVTTVDGVPDWTTLACKESSE
jgi:hypothetical protein